MQQINRLIKGIRFFVVFLVRFPLSSAIKLIRINSLRYIKKGNVDTVKTYPIIDVCFKDRKAPIYLRPCTSDSVIFNQIFIEKQYDIDCVRNCKTIIDCGANIGLSCIYFKMHNPDSLLIAVEPEQSNFELLKRNLQVYENIHPIQAGIWSKTCHLEIENLNVPNSSFRMKELENASMSSIPAITITQIIKDFNLKSVDLLKIDIESSEIDVFSKNCDEWLPFVKVLIIELHDWMKDGCSKTFFSALSHYEYTKHTLGENVIIEFKHH